MNLPRQILVLLVRLYQWVLSPIIATMFGPAARCRFTPSCSQYAIEALQTHGALKGGWLAVRRLCRCHPWGGCGEDPVPGRNLKATENCETHVGHEAGALTAASGGRS